MWEAASGLKTYNDEKIPKKGKQHGYSLSTHLPMVDVKKSGTGKAAASYANKETGKFAYGFYTFTINFTKPFVIEELM